MSAVEGLRDALAWIRDARVKPGTAVEAEGPFCHECLRYVPANRGHDKSAVCGIAERALSTWDTRGRLRDDRAFVSLILNWGLSNYIGHPDASAQEFADTIDTAVLGIRAPTGGET